MAPGGEAAFRDPPGAAREKDFDQVPPFVRGEAANQHFTARHTPAAGENEPVQFPEAVHHAQRGLHPAALRGREGEARMVRAVAVGVAEAKRVAAAKASCRRNPINVLGVGVGTWSVCCRRQSGRSIQFPSQELRGPPEPRRKDRR